MHFKKLKLLASEKMNGGCNTSGYELFLFNMKKIEILENLVDALKILAWSWSKICTKNDLLLASKK